MRIHRSVVLIGLLLLLFGCQKKPVAERGQPLGVEQLAKAPATYADRTLTVRGIVSSVDEKGAFTLIDLEEYKSCRELGCAAYEVPVAFAGALPDTAEAVLVSGRLEQPEPGRYLVRAERVEREQ